MAALHRANREARTIGSCRVDSLQKMGCETGSDERKAIKAVTALLRNQTNVDQGKADARWSRLSMAGLTRGARLGRRGFCGGRGDRYEVEGRDAYVPTSVRR